jgi:DNA-binding NarL/FixJ family response regulator
MASTVALGIPASLGPRAATRIAAPRGPAVRDPAPPAPPRVTPAATCAISIALLGGQRLVREATASLIAAQSGIELNGTFDSAADLLLAPRCAAPDIVLIDCDGDTEPWLASLTALARARTPSLIAMLCQSVSRDIAGYATSHGVGGVILKSYSAEDIRASLVYMSSGRTVLPGGWQRFVAESPLQTPPLSPRHRQILAMIALGESNEEIATSLSLSPNTVKFHVRVLYARLGVRNRVEAARRYAQTADDAR